MLSNEVIAAESGAADVRPLIQILLRGGSLRRGEARRLFDALAMGVLSQPEVAAILAALKVKGEEAEEVIGAALALRAYARSFPRPDYLFVDVVGTGGDGADTINLSTAAALIAAACGLPVAKHGNRSVSSRCGAADVLEAFGVDVDLPAERARRCLDETGFTFLLAPRYHPALAEIAPVRRELRTYTIFNLLGPLLNPALPSRMLIGVADPSHCRTVALAAQSLGVERALIVHGAGIDEIAVHGPTRALLLEGGRLHTLQIRPEDFGEKPHSLQELRGGSPQDNAAALRELFTGKGTEAQRAALAVNAGALLWLGGRVRSLREGGDLARAAMRGGMALRRLQVFAEASRRRDVEAR